AGASAGLRPGGTTAPAGAERAPHKDLLTRQGSRGRLGPMRRLLIACLFSLALLATAAPAALAAGPIKWFGRTLVDGSGNSDINQRSLRSVACTTPHFCVVGDNKGNA